MIIDSTRIGEIVDRRTGAINVFRRHGIDCSRAFGRPLGEVVSAHRLDLAQITTDLAGLPGAAKALPATARELVRHIQHRYHRPHLNRLFTALRLARSQEGRERFPAGLSAHVACLAECVEAHQEKERDILFPAIVFSPRHNLRFSVLRVMMEHDEMIDELDTIARLTGDHTPPDRATKSWRALYDLLRQIDEEMRFQIYLENAHLYAKFTPSKSAA